MPTESTRRAIFITCGGRTTCLLQTFSGANYAHRRHEKRDFITCLGRATSVFNPSGGQLCPSKARQARFYHLPKTDSTIAPRQKKTAIFSNARLWLLDERKDTMENKVLHISSCVQRRYRSTTSGCRGTPTVFQEIRRGASCF